MIRSFSYGGGVQSTACLVLAAQGRIDFPLFLFANVGDDSEDESTLAYVRTVAMPYAEAHGIEMVELVTTWQRGERKGETQTLLRRLDAGRMAIPVRRSKNGKPMRRSCTADFKIKRITRELKARGATADDPALVGIGISVDEAERASPGVDHKNPEQFRTYPLLPSSPLDPYSPGLGIHRHECETIIRKAGLPVPGKSACWFCPFHDAEAWRRLKRTTPDKFAAACALEARMSAATKDGKPVYLTRAGRPLAEVVDDQQPLFTGMDGCDSGYCMT